MPSNQEPYTAEQVEQIKQRIIAAWQRVIDPDGPPSAEAVLEEARKLIAAMRAT